MPSPEITTNYRTSDGVDLGKTLVSKDYLISVYPQIANQIITPELWVWGSNSRGGLGDNQSNNNICTPVTTFPGGSNWKVVGSGAGNATGCVAIKTDGTLWTWGNSFAGQLGDNTAPSFGKSTPVTTFAGGTNWKQCSSGGYITAAIKTDGTLWVWGGGTGKSLGNNQSNNNICTPVTTFAGGTNWKQVHVGGSSMAAIKTDGTLWTWGAGGSGQLGDRAFSSRLTPITTSAGGTNWKQVSVGGNYMAAIKTDGTLWTWGRSSEGQLGNNNDTVNSGGATPVTTFAGGTNWKQLSAGTDHTAAIKTDGTLWTWGLGTFGRLGDNTTTSKSTPVTTFAGGTNWKQVSCGDRFTAAIKTDGTLWTWGNNPFGQLGDNTITSKSTPVTTFAGGTNWKQVSACGAIAAAIKTVDYI